MALPLAPDLLVPNLLYTLTMKLNEIWRRRLLPPQTGRLTPWLSRLLPPVILDAIRYPLSEWEYLPQGWRSECARGPGWRDASIAKAQEKHWPMLVRNLQGPGPLGVSHFLRSVTRDDPGDHNVMMAYGYVLARAARNKDHVSLLDWGGSLGHYYLYSQALLPEVKIDYHCYENSSLCAVGRRLLPQVHFSDDTVDILHRQYDLVVSSSSLHYFKDWRSVAQDLAAATGEYLYIARLQTVVRGNPYVVVQRPYRSGYHAEYLSWFLNPLELISCLEEARLELVREFVYAENWLVRGAPEKGDCRGFLFRRPSKRS